MTASKIAIDKIIHMLYILYMDEIKSAILSTVAQRLAKMNLAYNELTYSSRYIGITGGQPRYQISVSEEVKETCNILGRYDEEEMKARMFWFATFHPEIYAQMIDADHAADTDYYYDRYGK